jgi:uncharacterized protein (TIGR00255 family)
MASKTGAVASMTGFASASSPTPLGLLSVEVRSVNSRFLDLSLRVGDELRLFEPMLREAVAGAVARGKVELRLWIQRHGQPPPPRVNDEALREFAALAETLRAAVPHAAPVSVADMLAWPGVVETPTVDGEALRGALQTTLDDALSALTASRQREGAALHAILTERCDAIDAIVAQMRPRVPEILAGLERKLAERLTQALTPALEGGSVSREEIVDRIRQEVTLYGLRADVDEELKRLATHVAEVRRVLKAGGAVGRRLDFLMQELNREANTLGSKASAIDLTQAAVELKLAIEQMREQIQNLE